MILKIDTSFTEEYKKWKETIELLERISQKHQFKPAKSISEDIYRFGKLKRETDILQEQIVELIKNF
jgi:hypothetical protein